MIKSSKRPILYVGKGALDASKELNKFIRRNNIPITTTLHAMGIFNEYEKLSLEMVGMHGSVVANKCIQESDLIIALGSRFDDRTTGDITKYGLNAKKIHINIDSKEKNKVLKVNLFINSDVKSVLKELLKYNLNNTDENSFSEWLEHIKQLKKKYYFDYEKTSEMKTQDVIKEFNKYLKDRPDNYIITTGVGNHQMMCSQYIKWKYPRRMITSGSLGAMGTGLSYAIGCQIANNDKNIINIEGDGSFNMTLMELSTIKRYNLPIKIFIINNQSQDMVRVWEKLFYNNRIVATELPSNPDYVKLAEAYGIKGIKCDDKKKVKDVIEECLDYDGPYLIEFRTVTDYCLPLVAPGKALDEVYNYGMEAKIHM